MPVVRQCRTVEFTVIGVPCLGLNGGPQLQHSEALRLTRESGTRAETPVASQLARPRTRV
ncbi:MAG: VOC family protein [Gammaproteobacteria bacterium]|nr:VOC family protein [Gammaproteobacteria bacterium]